MKKSILSLILMVAMLPLMANAYEQLADGVYKDGSTLYIGSGVTSLGNLQVNPTTIYCYTTIPPACSANTFTGYGAELHVPSTIQGIVIKKIFDAGDGIKCVSFNEEEGYYPFDLPIREIIGGDFFMVTAVVNVNIL